MIERNGAVPPQIAGLDRPDGDGPATLLLERVEKRGLVLFWRDGRWQVEQIYGP